MDPEDNFKAQLAEIANNRARRRVLKAFGLVVLFALLMLGCVAVVLLTSPHPTAVIGTIVLVLAGMLTGVAMMAASDAKIAYDRARDVHEKWQVEIELQNREAEREHEDGDFA